MAGQLVVIGAWLHARGIAVAQVDVASGHYPGQHCTCKLAIDVRQWAAGVDRHFRHLGMASHFTSSKEEVGWGESLGVWDGGSGQPWITWIHGQVSKAS